MNNRDFTRPYCKDYKFKSGIYLICNSFNNQVYVGSTSMEFHKRWNHHATNLRLNTHGNQHLQNAYNKYENCEWRFEILEVVEDLSNDNLIKREKYWIYDFNKKGIKLFNLQCAENGRFYHSEETKKKISQSKIGKTPAKPKYPRKIGLYQVESRIPVVEFHKGEYVKEYESLKQAALENDISYKAFHLHVCGKTKRITGYPETVWVYKNKAFKEEEVLLENLEDYI